MIPIANACDALELRWHNGKLDTPAYKANTLFRMWAGAASGAGVEAYVWARSFEDAFERFVDYLDDQKLCGVFVTVGISELEDAALALGLPTAVAHDDQHPDFHKVVDKAEEDLTIVGHTTLQNCPNPAYLLSYDWGGDELDWEQNLDVVRESYRECSGHAYLPGETVYFLYDDVELDVKAGDVFMVFATISSEVELINAADEELTLEGEYAKNALTYDLPPQAVPTRRSTGYSTPVDEEEKKKQADFFFPKSTLPKSRPGGGGFLGVPQGGLRNPFRRG